MSVSCLKILIKKLPEQGGKRQKFLEFVANFIRSFHFFNRLLRYNPYDMRIKCAHGNLCYDFSQVDKFLNKPETREAIGATKRWSECNRFVNLMFQQDWMKDYETKLPDLLSNGIRVLVSATKP